MTRLWLTIASRRVACLYNIVLAGALLIIVVLAMGSVGLGQALSARADRSAARTVEGHHEVAAASQDITVGSETFTLVGVWARSRAAEELGVSLDALPQPGESLLSPALSDFLKEDESGVTRLVRARIPGVTAGHADDGLLLGPDERVAFVGFPTSESAPDHAWGPQASSSAQRMALLGVTVLLLLPGASLVFVAAQFDGRRRIRVLSDLRLLGVRAWHLRALAVLEASMVAAAAIAAGLGVWLLVRGPFAASGIAGDTYFSDDLAIAPLGLGGIAVVTIVVSCIAALSTADHALKANTPTGEPGLLRPRRAWLPATVLALGVLTLHVTTSVGGRLSDAQLGMLELTSIGLAIVGLIGLGPSLLWTVGRVLADRIGSVTALLAGRRLQFDAHQAFRCSGGVIVVAFMFGGFAALDLQPPPHHDGSSSEVASSLRGVELNGHDGERLVERLEARGLRPVALAYRLVEHQSLVALATCRQLSTGLHASFTVPCEQGRAYRVPGAKYRQVGSSIQLGQEAPHVGTDVLVSGELSLKQNEAILDGLDAVVAVSRQQLAESGVTRIIVNAPEAAGETVLSEVAQAAPLAQVMQFGDRIEPGDGLADLGETGRVALVGAFLLAGAALAMASADASLRRQETAALLFAVGTPRRSRVGMIATEVGLPLILAALPATLLGAELVFVGGSLVGGDVRVPVGDLLIAVAATGLVSVLAVGVTMVSMMHLPTTAILQAEH